MSVFASRKVDQKFELESSDCWIRCFNSFSRSSSVKLFSVFWRKNVVVEKCKWWEEFRELTLEIIRKSTLDIMMKSRNGINAATTTPSGFLKSEIPGR